MFDTLHPAATAAHNANTFIQWQHAPRDHNPVAEKLANEGADTVANGTHAGRCNINGKPSGQALATTTHPSIATKLKSIKRLPLTT